MSKRQTRMAKAQRKVEPLRPPKQELARQYEQAPVQPVTPQAAFWRVQASRGG